MKFIKEENDKMFRVIRIMDFNRTEPTCLSTIFPYASSS